MNREGLGLAKVVITLISLFNRRPTAYAHGLETLTKSRILSIGIPLQYVLYITKQGNLLNPSVINSLRSSRLNLGTVTCYSEVRVGFPSCPLPSSDGVSSGFGLSLRLNPETLVAALFDCLANTGTISYNITC